VPISFKIKGNLSQIGGFIEELYKNLRLVRIKSVSLSTENELQSPTSDFYIASLQIEAAYFLSEEALNASQSGTSTAGK